MSESDEDDFFDQQDYDENQKSDQEDNIAESNDDNSNINLFGNIQDLEQQNEEEKRKQLMQELNIGINQIPSNDDLSNDENQQNPNIIVEEKILQKIIDKRENELKKMTNKLRANPQQYMNFIKTYILIEMISVASLLKMTQNPILQCQVISKINLDDLDYLEEIFIKKQNKQHPLYNKNFERKLPTLMHLFKKNFVFKTKRDEKQISENLEQQNNKQFGYNQMLQIFLIISKYLGIEARLSYIQNLSSLDLGDKLIFKQTSKQMQNLLKSKNNNSKKAIRSIKNSDLDDDENDINYQQKSKKLVNKGGFQKNTKNISSFLENQIFNQGKKGYRVREKVEILTEDDEEDEDDENNNKQNKQEESENLENMLSEFKFEKKPRKPQSRRGLASNNLKAPPKKLSEIQNNKANNKNENKMENEGVNKQKKEMEVEEQKIPKQQDTLYDINMNNVDLFANQKKKKGIFDNEKDKEKTQNDYKKQKEQMNDFYSISDKKIWIDIYDQEEKKWISIDPIHQQILTKTSIQEKLLNIAFLFIFSVYNLDIKDDEQELEKLEYQQRVQANEMKNYLRNRPLNTIFFLDTSPLYVDSFLKLQVNRKKVRLNYWFEETLEKNLRYPITYPLKNQQNVFHQNQIDAYTQLEQLILEEEKKEIPYNTEQFKVSKHYIVKSEIDKYSIIHPDAKPVMKQQYKDEDIYDKNQVIKLNGRTRWIKQGRKVKKGEKALKQVSSIMGQGKMVDLFAIWQTEQYIVKINDDGTLPKNEYNNFDLMNNQKLPEGVSYINLPYIGKILKKHQIEYVDCVVGFEKGKAGFSHAVKQGVIVHQKDEKQIYKLYDKCREEIEEQNKQTIKNNLFKTWRKLFKSILLKKQINDKYAQKTKDD